MDERRVAWTVWGVTVGLLLVWILVGAAIPKQELDYTWYAFVTSAILLYATVGALITSRRMGNRVGWLFSWVALSATVGGTSGAYASLALGRDLPFLAAAAWVAQIAFAAMIGPLAFLFLIFPTGSPPSRRWGWIGRVMLGAYAVTIVLFAITPGPLEAGFAEQHGIVNNPIGLPASWERPIEALTTITGSVVFVGAIVSILSLIQRYRRAASSERQQIRWLAWLGGFIGAYVLVFFPLELFGVLPENGGFANATFIVLILLIFVGIPVTCAVAILRHGLWDLDVVVKKTVQYGVLLVASMVVIGLLVILPGVWFVEIDVSLPDIAIGLLLAIVLALLRLPARRFANRVVYGKRSTPYEVLSAFAERVGGTYSTEDVLPRMAQLLGEATGAREARVWLHVGDVMRVGGSWPGEAPHAPDVPAPSDALPELVDDRSFEVRHQGELLGALTVSQAPDDPMNLAKEKLARDMAAQAGLVLRNVRLIEELRESRRRIVSAQDERARKLERDIHDGVQQQLVALSVKLRLAGTLLNGDPEKVGAILADLQTQAGDALDDLRDLARGIYPPLLADRGLAAAVEAQAGRATVPVAVEPDGLGRYDQEVESAIYYCCLEALNNIAKYADASSVTIRLSERDGWVRFEVTDDGVGFDPTGTHRGTGLQGIADRIDALGGRFEVRSRSGAGTTLSGTVPLQGAR